MKKYRVTLTPDEREQLTGLIATGKAAAQKLTHARILLKADQADGGPAWIDDQVADALDVSVATVERVRQRFVEDGLEAALGRKKQDKPSRVRTLDGAGEARLIALACSPAPEGRVAWTLKMLANKLVELEVVDSICPETVRQTLKKTRSSRGGGSSGASRPRRTRRSCARWRTCWRCTTGPTTRNAPWSAWTRRASNWSGRRSNPSRRSRARPSGSTTSTSAAVRTP